MDDKDLKNKYQPVADFMSRSGFQVQHFHVENGRVVLTASAPTEYLKNRAWDEIKKIDPNFADLQHDITVGSGTMYIVKSGDNLSNISKSFCGSHSLINLFRLVGGTLRSQKTQLEGDGEKTPKYNLELIAKVREIPATELSLIIESMTRLAQEGRAVECLRVNVETVVNAQGVLRAA